MAGDVTFAGGARFISNRVAGASLKSGEHGSGGAIHVAGWLGNSTLTFGGPAMFRNNTAARGGAVTLAGLIPQYPPDKVTAVRIKFTDSRRSSCWVANHAHKLAGGAALLVELGGRVEFGTLSQHNFGSNTAGSPSNRTRDDIVVLVNGSYACGDGSYSVEGNVCSKQCSAQHTCDCPLGQKFDALKCSCQSGV
jgi:hypothetical protein